MGLFNLVSGPATCPRCGNEIDADVETRLGFVQQVLALRVGDHYPWNHAEMPSARPEGGNAIGDGYCVCPACGRDFFVKVVIDADVIRRLEPDTERAGMIPDRA